MTHPNHLARGACAQRCPRTTVVHASITANGVETPYARLGAGAPVLLLQDPPRDLASDDLARALATHFRVIAPLVPAALAAPPAGGFAAWVRDLLDGLGAEGADILTSGVLGPPALALARSDPLRVRRVVVVGDAGADASPGAVLATLLAGDDARRDD